jgi:uncharacterized protein
VPVLTLQVPGELRFLLPPVRRGGTVTVNAGDTDTFGHVVQSAGIPLTEVGALGLDGRAVAADDRIAEGRLVIDPVRRPQPTPTSPARFLLDVHLGGLARQLRILGVDAAYRPDADDPELAEWAAAERRVLLTQDRGLLRRRAVVAGALVRGAGTPAQLDDVLDRFAPVLAPWTRCPNCDGVLEPVSRAEVISQLQPGTRRTYHDFSRCPQCLSVYWHGAHARRLEQLVTHAREVVARSSPGSAVAPTADGRR